MEFVHPKNELIYVCLTKHKDGASSSSSSSSTPNDAIMVVVPSEIFIYLFIYAKIQDERLFPMYIWTMHTYLKFIYLFI